MRKTDALAAWTALNDRQRTYLQAVFDDDQEAERGITADRARRRRTPPASEWRWRDFGPVEVSAAVAGYSDIQLALRRVGIHDPGAGSTLSALRRRGLLATRTGLVDTALGLIPYVQVQMTPAGRAAVRAGTGTPAPRRTPAGLMSQWRWRALILLYQAGEQGLPLRAPRGTPDEQRLPAWTTLQPLRDERRDGPYIAEFSVPAAERAGWDDTGERVRLTPQGRRHYQLHHACYRDAYPDLAAPAPDPIDGAHRSLAEHTARPAGGLVREPAWRVLAHLAQITVANQCVWRARLRRYYRQHGVPVPDEVDAIQPGLLPEQLTEITRSTTALGQLTDHPDGPLVTTIAAPNPPHYDVQPGATVPLIVLTELGRAHIAGRLDKYQRAYPDVVSAEVDPLRLRNP